MKLSWKWLKETVDLSKIESPQALADALTARGLEIEGVHRLDAGFEKVVSVKILKRDKHPQADRLSLCTVSLGSGESLEIVCGAQNMKAGDIVALAQIGAKLPNGLKIELSKIRGVVSNGMLCSEEELGLKEEAEGILILPPSTPLGKPVAEILKRDDTVFEVKLTPNRGDCLSVIGIAREVASIAGVPLKMPELEKLSFGKLAMSTALEAGDKGLQFFGAIVEGVKIGPSPDWMKERLETVGLRSINNVVDCTNYVMLELGQPVHAYDLTRLEGSTLAIRMARKGERLPLLDASEVELEGSELVIADSKKAVALAGVMGGGNSEVTDGTTKLFLEVAEFNPVLVRKASKKFLKHTDAAQRFERGVDPQGQERALSRLVKLIVQTAGGKCVGATKAQHPSREKQAPKKILFASDFIPSILGLNLTKGEMTSALKSLECGVSDKGQMLEVTPPSYRLDLSIREDFVEEVARVVGFDRIPTTIPTLTNTPTITRTSEASKAFQTLERAKDILAELGLSETLQYSFMSAQWLAEFGLKSSVRVVNPLSEQQEFMVPSLIPGLVAHAQENLRKHFGSESVPLRFFQIRPTFHASGAIEQKGEMQTTVEETWKVAFVLSGNRTESTLKNEAPEIDFYDAKAIVEGFFARMGTRGVRLRALGAPSSESKTDWLHSGQSAEIWVGKDRIGVFGRLHPKLEKRFKLRQKLWCLEMDWKPIVSLSRSVVEVPRYQAWSTQPSMERDFALLVKEGVESEKITQVAMKAGKPLAKVVKVFDIYRGSQVAQGMTSVAVRVIFGDDNRSLQEAETDQASTAIRNAWKKELGIELRG